MTINLLIWFNTLETNLPDISQLQRSISLEAEGLGEDLERSCEEVGGSSSEWGVQSRRGNLALRFPPMEPHSLLQTSKLKKYKMVLMHFLAGDVNFPS